MRHPRIHGFTLIEMVVTVAISAVLLAVAAPALVQYTANGRISAHADSFSASARLARSEAIKRNAATTMCVSSNGTSCVAGGWESGWIVMAGTTVLHKEGPASQNVRMTESSSVATLSFDPAGVGATVATVTVCSSAGGLQERVVSVSATGRVSTRRTQTGVCPVTP